MARSTPIHSGYTIVNGTGTGPNGDRIDVWVEYKIGAYSIAGNYTPFTAYFYAALASGKTSSTSANTGLNSAFTVNGTAGTSVSNGSYDFRSTSKANLLGSYSGNIGHSSDGTKSITISGSFTTTSTWITGGSVTAFTVTFPTIPRASTISYAADVTLGNPCSVKWTPLAAAFRYKLRFSIGSWSYTTGIIHPNQTTVYTYSGYCIPIETANQFATETGTMTVTLYTYSDTAGSIQIADAHSATFTVAVPDNDDTKPVVSMELTAVSPFEGVYLQRISKITAAITAEGQYGASIESYGLLVDGKSCNGLTSDYLTTVGTVTVTGTATDSRGHTGTAEMAISVLAYDNPKIRAVAYRCDSEGNAAADGTYLKISATRSYSPVDSLNKCEIRYRYKEDRGEYGGWITILEESAESDSVTTGALLDGSLDKTKAYIIQVGVVDTVGTEISTTINIPSESIYQHRPSGGNGMGLGGYLEVPGYLDVHWNQRVRKDFTCDGAASFVGDVTCGGAITAASVNGMVREFFRYRGICGDADVTYEAGIYRINADSTNAPNTNGIMLVFNCSDNTGPLLAPVLQIAMDYAGNNRKIRMIWYSNNYGWQNL